MHLSSAFRRGRTSLLMDYPAADMDCILRVDTRFVGWDVMLFRVLDSIDGITYNMDGEKGTVHIRGRINPRQLTKTLAELGLHADLSRTNSRYPWMNIPLRHGYDYGYHGGYGYNPYGRSEYYYYYSDPPPQHRNWHPVHENYPHYSEYHHNYPYYESVAQYFPQPPPQPVGFRNGDPQWCSIM
ncbi:hypothetical protein DITRI_Ditri01bG0189200 [Diplodiscus trichospermus]